jgi:hypothetical protein
VAVPDPASVQVPGGAGVVPEPASDGVRELEAWRNAAPGMALVQVLGGAQELGPESALDAFQVPGRARGAVQGMGQASVRAGAGVLALVQEPDAVQGMALRQGPWAFPSGHARLSVEARFSVWPAA